MSTMERILRLMAEKKASDVYLSANAPTLIKINGQCVPINNQLLPPDAPQGAAGRGAAGQPHDRAGRDRRAEHGARASRAWAASASRPCASAAPMPR